MTTPYFSRSTGSWHKIRAKSLIRTLANELEGNGYAGNIFFISYNLLSYLSMWIFS